MGWVGVATLVATTCYVLYRFPPRTWMHPDPTVPRASPESIPEQQNANDRGKLSPKIPEIKPVLDKTQKKEEEEENAETTPKASAVSAPILDVPELDLNDQKSIQNGPTKKSEPAPGQQNHNPSSLRQSTAKVARNESVTMPPPPLPPRQPVPTPSPRNSSLMPPPAPPRQRIMGQQTQQSQLLSPGGYPPRPGPGYNNNTNKGSSGSGSFLAPPPSAAAAQRGPPQRSSSLAPPSNSLAPPPTQSASLKPSKAAPSRRAILEPGYSPLDWAALASNPKNNLRGANLPPTLIRVTPSMLKAQNGRKGNDAWTSYQGKVYNITPYVPFHPGGKGELLRGAGKDSAKLFLEVHPWVNWDAILNECLVGILVSESEAAPGGNALDAMD